MLPYSEEIIKYIETIQTNCMKMSKEVEKTTKNIDESKKELNEMIHFWATKSLHSDLKYFRLNTCLDVLMK